MEETSVRIVIVEDDKVIREGYRFLIGEKQGYQVINTYSTAEQAIKKLTEDNPDLVMLDVGLPGISGIEAIQKIKAVLPHTLILICTVHDSEDIIFRALTNGASGYLTKNSSAVKIMESIREIMQGGASMSGDLDTGGESPHRSPQCG